MAADAQQPVAVTRSKRASRDWPFLAGLIILGGSYVLLVIAMVLADTFFTSPHHILAALASPQIQYSIKLSLISCSVTALLSLWVAVPLGYLMSRYQFRGKDLVDSILDIPIVLPPLVLGLSLLILFQVKIAPGMTVDDFFRNWLHIPVTYAIPSVILAQFSVACAFAVRTMRVTFDQISPRSEQVALTLGCSRSQAFWLVVLPGGAARYPDRRHPRLGSLARRIRSHPRFLRRHPHEDRGAVHFRLPGTEHRQPRSGRRRLVAHDHFGDSRPAAPAPLWFRTRLLERNRPGMIRFENVSLRAGRFALSGIDLVVPTGAYGVLMGRTGSGKTTLLEAVCGIRAVLSGRIYLLGTDVTNTPPSDRGIGYVPQDRALFQTMTVREHLAFALAIRKWSRPAIDARVQELAQLLGLQQLLDRKPQGLSGGESQRVALGRALASKPGILCLDEPLSALDDETREEMYSLLESVQKYTGVTVLHVTHHRGEADRLADRVYRLDQGRVSQEVEK